MIFFGEIIMNDIRELPYSNDAEQAIIGSVFIDPDCITEILDVINSDSFYNEKNKHIFAAMIELFEHNTPIDVVTVSDLLTRNGLYDVVGGNGYIQEIIAGVPLSMNVRSYAEIVKEKAMLRKLLTVCEEIHRECYQSSEVSNVMELAISKVFDVAQSRDNKSVTHIKSIVYENYNSLAELIRSGAGFSGLSTGYIDIDAKLQGLKPGNLVLIAARPAMGKSSFAANIAQNVAIRQNIPVAMFTLEMSKEELANRIICSESKINNMKLKAGELSKDEIFQYIEAIDPVANSPFYIDDTAAISTTELRAKCKRLKLEKGLGLVVIDYLQLMSGNNKESRQNEIADISRSLKLLAKELEIPVIALSQLSRAVDQRKDDHIPMLSDLRESGAIEQDADIVMFLYRDEVYNENTTEKNIAQCIIAKNRAGETGKVRLTWLGEYTTFYTTEQIHNDEF